MTVIYVAYLSINIERKRARVAPIARDSHLKPALFMGLRRLFLRSLFLYRFPRAYMDLNLDQFQKNLKCSWLLI